MKNLVFILMLAFSASMFSCGNAATTETGNDSIDTTVVDTVSVDSIDSVVDSTK